MHARWDIDIEGAAALAGAAVGALGGVVREVIICLLDFGGNGLALGLGSLGLIKQFVDLGNLYAVRTGGAMVAIGAFARPYLTAGAAEGCIIVLLGIGGMEVVQVGKEFVDGAGATDDRRHARFGEGVCDALVNGEREMQRGTLGIQQFAAAAAESLHHRDGDVVLGTIVIEFDTYGVDAGKHLLVGLGIPCADIRAETVEGRIDAEHDDLDKAALGSLEGGFGVMAAETDVLDFPFGLELLDIFHIRGVHQRIPLLRIIDDMDHTHLDMVGAQHGEQVFKALFALLDIAGAFV